MKQIIPKSWKTTIMGVVQSLVVYLLATNIIGPNEAMLISGIATAFGYGINVYTNKK